MVYISYICTYNHLHERCIRSTQHAASLLHSRTHLREQHTEASTQTSYIKHHKSTINYVQLSSLWQGRTGFALPPVQQSRNRHEDPLPMDKGLPHAHAGAGSHELPAPPPHLPQARSGGHRAAFGRAISSPTRPVSALCHKPLNASCQASLRLASNVEIPASTPIRPAPPFSAFSVFSTWSAYIKHVKIIHYYIIYNNISMWSIFIDRRVTEN